MRITLLAVLLLVNSFSLFSQTTFDDYFLLRGELKVVETGDIDGNGLDDVFTFININNTTEISIYLNEGDLMFSEPINFDFSSSNIGNPTELRVLDIDMDGKNDVLLLGYNNIIEKIASWFKNIGNNEFNNAIELTNEMQELNAIQLLDFDNDTDLDILANATIDSIPGIYKRINDGSGNFGGVELVKEYHSSITSFEVYDLTNNGFNDIMFSAETDPIVGIFYNENDTIYQIDSLFNGFVDCPNPAYTNPGKQIFLEKIDNDDSKDLIAVTRKFLLLYNNENGYFETVDTLVEIGTSCFQGSKTLSSPALTDLDNDGDIDVLVIYYRYGGELLDFPISLLYFLYNDGDGNFQLIIDDGGAGEIFGPPQSSLFRGLKILDIENDGDVDFITNRKVNPSFSPPFPAGDEEENYIYLNKLEEPDCGTNSTVIVDSFPLGESYTLANGIEVSEEDQYEIVYLIDEVPCEYTVRYTLSTYLVTGIVDLYEDLSVSISPNPSQQQRMLVFGNQTTFEYDVQIFDIRGKRIVEYENQSSTNLLIDFPFDPGNYFVSIYKDGSSELIRTLRMTVQ